MTNRALRLNRLTTVLAIVVLWTAVVSPTVSGQPAVQDNYVLGPGDTIEVVVYGEPDLSRTVTIKPDGAISLPLLGEVKAAGRTTTQLAADLSKLYTKYLKQPSIIVTVREFRVDRIYILGQVSRPGEYQLRPGVGLMELLASAGGPTTRADLAKVVVIRGRTEAVQLNLLEALAKSQNPDVRLLPGDVLFVPEADNRITVLGEVNRPGAYQLLEGQRVSDLVAAAGGLTSNAAPQSAFVVRGGQQVPVDVQKVLAGDMEANIPLRPGDMMIVPQSQNRIAVMGAVRNPGVFRLVDNMKLIDALAGAGGPTDNGSLTNVTVVRIEGGQPKPIVANLEKALNGSDISQNLVLQNGDVVFVAEKGFNITDIRQWLNLFNLSRILFGAFF